ncbi:hypothetical protein NE619_14530 [Anaerovorax odorimutans]|uniref:DUF523 domain-containing protein n=1 Tax=Anaerovorax odorimutans TaxID=109327 RepID=A0ABT1RRX7_9FIRM|nr:hypothetical protein [Anaerovorax odorimutans]MCQ4637949.1 hypothetical protein [Anaerovorax odorimutans]
MKKLALISHCVLNSLCEMPEASDAFRKQILNLLTDKKISMVQLPCPELCFQSLERESIVAGDSKSREYEEYCRKLLEPVLKNLKEYKAHDIEVAGIIGIGTSPSCSVMDSSAIMMKVLLEEMKANDIPHGKLLDMPVSGDGKDFFDQLETW